MSRRMPTLLVLVVMVLVGVMYWVDLRYYTDPQTGFVLLGTVWVRYAILLLPLFMGILGLHTVGVRAIATLRMRSAPLSLAFLMAGLMGFAYGVVLVQEALLPLQEEEQQLPGLWQLALGLLFLWYGVWMALASWQMLRQRTVSPTRSAVFGLVAALPFCALTMYRVLVKPTTLYRVGPFVKNFSALFAMLWFGVLLRALYIALVRSRVRWMYGLGIFTFLLATCLELPQAIYGAIYGGLGAVDVLEGLAMGTLGIVAGGVSVSIAGQAVPRPAGPPVEEGVS